MRYYSKDALIAIMNDYVSDVSKILGHDFSGAKIYGSTVRGEYNEDSDIDIAIFTDALPEKYFSLAEKIADITLDYNIRYEIIISPVFQNNANFKKFLPVLPYYQNIQKEGLAVG